MSETQPGALSRNPCCGALSPLSKLRIAFVAVTLGHGGAQTQLAYMLHALQEGGADLHVLSLTEGELWGERFRARGIPVTWVGHHGSRAQRLLRMVAALRRQPVAVIHSVHFCTNLYAAAAARLLGVREVGSVRSDGFFDVRSNGAALGRLSLRAPRVVAVNSPAGMRNVVALGLPPQRRYFLPNVMDTEHFQPAAGPPRPAGERAGPLQLLAVGRLSPEKRWERFVALVARLQGQAAVPVRGVLVGEGPERPRLERQAAALGLLPDRLQFRGAVPDPRAVYREGDILVLTSDWEGTPNVILEAMAAGLPTVATGVGGVRELVRDGETGYVVPAGDEEALTAALRALVAGPRLRQRMGRAAREYVTAHHALHRLPALLDGLYRKALAGRCRSSLGMERG